MSIHTFHYYIYKGKLRVYQQSLSQISAISRKASDFFRLRAKVWWIVAKWKSVLQSEKFTFYSITFWTLCPLCSPDQRIKVHPDYHQHLWCMRVCSCSCYGGNIYAKRLKQSLEQSALPSRQCLQGYSCLFQQVNAKTHSAKCVPHDTNWWEMHQWRLRTVKQLKSSTVWKCQ